MFWVKLLNVDPLNLDYENGLIGVYDLRLKPKDQVDFLVALGTSADWQMEKALT